MSESETSWILIGLGANLGAARETLQATMVELRRRYGSGGWRASSFWRSAPIDCEPGADPFVNAVVALPMTRALRSLTASGLLHQLLMLELDAGRPRQRAVNASRPLDLDLLVFGSQTSEDPACTLPHPRALQRRFVLEPAAEVLPTLVWPGSDACLVELAAVCRKRFPEQSLQRMTATSQY